ncbi:unnamed protein product [Sphagnum balticum]
MGRNGSCMQICFLFLVVYAATVERVVWAQTTSAPTYVPMENILISCGSSTNVTVDGGRVFQADNTATTLASGGTGSVSTFYPFAFANWAANASLFSVTANRFVLLDDFRPSSWTTPDFPSLFREYAVNVSSESLVLGFNLAPGSYAFINELEVVSMPSDLYSNDASLLGQAGSITPLGIEYPTTLPEYIALATVYATTREMGGNNTINHNFNLTWIFPIDLGYTYFVRLHFCEIFLSAIN